MNVSHDDEHLSTRVDDDGPVGTSATQAPAAGGRGTALMRLRLLVLCLVFQIVHRLPEEHTEFRLAPRNIDRREPRGER
jgi:hypothetical protein